MKKMFSAKLFWIVAWGTGGLLALFLLVGLPLVLLSPWQAGDGITLDSANERGSLGYTPTPFPFATPMPSAVKQLPDTGSGVARGIDAAPPVQAGASTGVPSLNTTQRQVISTASVSMEVESVQNAVTQVRSISEGLGGFVEALSGSGKGESQQANLTVRVPHDSFFTALDRIKALGDVINESAGSQDVTEQYIDLDARLKSAKTAEGSLLSLLGKVSNVSDVLTIERELSRVRSEIERLQGQLNFLQRRVDLSSISVNLTGPSVIVGQPPAAFLAVETSKVSQSADAVKSFVSSLKGVVESSSFSMRDGSRTAHLVLRVFPKDFQTVLNDVEARGNVISKDVQEGSASDAEKTQQPKDPNSRIEVTILEKPGFWTAGHIVAITAPVGGTLLAGLLALAIFMLIKSRKRKAA